MRAIVTGTSRGIGRGLAISLAYRGADVIGIARTPGLSSIHGLTEYIADIQDFSELQKIADQVKLTPGRIDLLVNNAGVFERSSLARQNPKSINQIIQTNLTGAILCTKAFLPLMARNSRVIFISSVAGLHGIQDQAVYCASKHGLTGFAEALRLELKSREIQITTIYPGGVLTPLWGKDNPYPGNLLDLLSIQDIVSAINYVVNAPSRTYIKQIVLHPEGEQH